MVATMGYLLSAGLLGLTVVLVAVWFTVTVKRCKSDRGVSTRSVSGNTSRPYPRNDAS